MNITIDLIWLCSYLTGYMTLSPWLYRTVYPWYRCDSLYSVIFSLSNIDCILTRTRVWGFALNSIPYGISIGADTVHSALFQSTTPMTRIRRKQVPMLALMTKCTPSLMKLVPWSVLHFYLVLLKTCL